MLKVGLTGSIAVGKSYVCDVFRELGCFILDADKVARDVVRPGTDGLARIVEEFGPAILAQDGRVDRSKLGALVFSDETKRKVLNSIVHPLVIERQNEWLTECERRDPVGIAIVDAALMIESGAHRAFDKLIVVWCEPEIQLKRLILRDRFSPGEARARIESQMPQDEKKRYADFLIDTSAGFEDTRRQTVEIHGHLAFYPLQ